MAIRKQNIKASGLVRVSFKLSGDAVNTVDSISVLGDFNNWDPSAAILKKNKKEGTFTGSVDLEKGKEYQFRYLLDGANWLNEAEADKQVVTVYGDSENSLLSL